MIIAAVQERAARKMQTTSKKLREKVIDVATALFMRACDAIEGGALRNVVISRAKLEKVVEQSRVLCEDYVYCRLQVCQSTLQ